MILQWLRMHGWWLALATIIIGVVAAAVSVWFLLRIPPDYFVREENSKRLGGYSTWTRRFVLIGKNILGIVFLIAGGLMSIPLVPGPGFLILLIGLSLTDFPGKRKWEHRLLRRDFIFRPINRLRTKMGQPPLER